MNALMLRCIEDIEMKQKLSDFFFAEFIQTFNYQFLAREISMNDLVLHLDNWLIAREISTYDIANEICPSDIAYEIDMYDLADNVSQSLSISDVAHEMAGNICADDVAEHIDMSGIEIDYDELSGVIDTDEIYNRVIEESFQWMEEAKEDLVSQVIDEISSRLDC